MIAYKTLFNRNAQIFGRLVLSGLIGTVFFVSSFKVSIHTDEFVQPDITLPFGVAPLFAIGMLFLFISLRPKDVKVRYKTLLGVISLLFSSLVSSIYVYQAKLAAVTWITMQLVMLAYALGHLAFMRRSEINPIDELSNTFIPYGALSFIFAFFLFVCKEIYIGDFLITQFPDYSRFYGWYGNPNPFSTVMGLFLISSVWVLLSRGLTLLRFAFVLVSLAGVLFGASKAVIVSLILSYIALGVLSCPRFVNFRAARTARAGMVAIIFLGVIAAVFFVAESYYFRLPTDVPFLDFSVSGRTEIWSRGFRLFVDAELHQQFFGLGFGYYENTVGVSAHSFYLKHLIENGLLFVTIFIWLNAALLFRAAQLVRSGSNHKKTIGSFCFLVLCFLLIRNFATPSFLQVRVENIVYFYVILVLLSPVVEARAKRNGQ